MAVAMFLGGLVALYGAAWAVDRLRGVRPEWRPLETLRALEERHAPDDAPLWAEVVGGLLAPGLFVRSGLHVFAALLARADPHVVDNDVTAGNVVGALRDELHADLGARVLALAAGVTLWLLFDPLSMPFGGPAWVAPVGRGFVVANLAVLVGDPLLLAWYRLRLRTTDSTDMTLTSDTPERTGTPATDGGRAGGER